jgi:hypothetical protein
VRALNPVERWYWIADQIAPLNVVARAHVQGGIPVPLLRRSLDLLQVRHPLLQARIQGLCGEFTAADRPIPLVEATTADWVAQADAELDTRIDWRAGPLCRATVLAGGDLLLTLPHCIADGTTVLSLLQEWLTIAGGQEPGGPLPLVDSAPPAGAAFRLLRHTATDWLRTRANRPARLTPDTFVPFDRRRTRLIHRSLDAAEVAALARSCRRERATVHGALAAAMANAVAEELNPPRRRVAIGSPVDLRRDLVPPVPPDAVGAYVATVASFVEHGSLWRTARSISRDVDRRRRTGGHLAVLDLVGVSGPKTLARSGRFVNLVERSGPVNVCLSNLGRVDFPARIGPWEVSGAQFVAGLSVCGYFVATVNTSHGRLHWNFLYVEDAVAPERAERLVERSVGAIHDAIKAEATA